MNFAGNYASLVPCDPCVPFASDPRDPCVPLASDPRDPCIPCDPVTAFFPDDPHDHYESFGPCMAFLKRSFYFFSTKIKIFSIYVEKPCSFFAMHIFTSEKPSFICFWSAQVNR